MGQEAYSPNGSLTNMHGQLAAATTRQLFFFAFCGVRANQFNEQRDRGAARQTFVFVAKQPSAVTLTAQLAPDSTLIELYWLSRRLLHY